MIGGVGVAMAEFGRSVAAAQQEAERWEEAFSRFRTTSELSRLNRANGQTISVSPLFLRVLLDAMEGVRQSHGRFDPAMLPALEAAGYDRSFDLLSPDTVVSGPVQPVRCARSWVDSTRVNSDSRSVTLPPGVRLDFGGIAKGAFVDAAVEALADWPGGFVEAGGDLRVWGEPPTSQRWTTGIENPAHPGKDILSIELGGAMTLAIATSGTTKRRWTRAGGHAHHLIDPASGLPLSGGVASATVLAATATAAEVESKSLLVAASRGETVRLCCGSGAILIHESGALEVIHHETIVDRPLPAADNTSTAA